MSDLEDRLRDVLSTQVGAYEPSDDLAERIGHRVRRRQRAQRARRGGAALVLAVAGVAGVAVATGDDQGSDGVLEMAGEGEPGPSTAAPQRTSVTTSPGTTVPEAPATTTPPSTAPASTAPPPSTATTAPAPSTATTSTTTVPPAEVRVDDSTPLTRAGIGPIRAGMTLRAAQEVADVTIAPPESPGPGATCAMARIEATELWFLVTRSGDPAADPFDAVIQSVQGGQSTVEGIEIGSTLADLRATYGEPTRTAEYPYLPGGQVHVYEEGSYAYSATVDGESVVTELESGLPEGVANLEGCA